MRILSAFLLTLISTAPFAYQQTNIGQPQQPSNTMPNVGQPQQPNNTIPNVGQPQQPDNTVPNVTQQPESVPNNNQEPEYLLNFNSQQDTTADEFTDVPNEPTPSNAIGY